VVCKTKAFTSAGLSLKQYKSFVVGVIGMPDKKKLITIMEINIVTIIRT